MVRIFSQYVSPKSLLLAAVESCLIVLSLIAAVRLRFWNDPSNVEIYTALPDFAIQALVIVITFQVCFYFNELYDFSSIWQRNEQWMRLGQSMGAACLLLGLIYFLVPGLLVGRGIFFISLCFLAVLMVLSRLALERVWRLAPAQSILILGTGDLALTVSRELTKRRDLHIRVSGFIQENGAQAASSQSVFGDHILGSVDELVSLVDELRISRIVVALEDRRGVLPVGDLVRMRVQGVTIEDAHSTMASLTGRVWLRAVRPSWFVFTDGFRRSRVTAMAKRAIDLAFGLLGFIVSAPIMLLVAVAVRLDSRGPILYRQVRVGWKGHNFDVLKFRSMRADAEAGNGAQWALENDPRVTRVGRIIRKYRLDELPQFINVIRGEMSFVGPRPERPVFVEQLRKQIPYYDERHSVRPGITGWAQVQYRYGASIQDSYNKLEYDLFYLKNMSVLFDCAIVLQTLRTVVLARGGR